MQIDTYTFFSKILDPFSPRSVRSSDGSQASDNSRDTVPRERSQSPRQSQQSEEHLDTTEEARQSAARDKFRSPLHRSSSDSSPRTMTKFSPSPGVFPGTAKSNLHKVRLAPSADSKQIAHDSLDDTFTPDPEMKFRRPIRKDSPQDGAQLCSAWLLALRVMAVGFLVTWIVCQILSGAPADLNEKPQQTEAKLAAMDKARALGIDKQLDGDKGDFLSESMKLVSATVADISDQLTKKTGAPSSNSSAVRASKEKLEDPSGDNAKKTVMHALMEQMMPDALKKDARIGEIVILSPRHGGASIVGLLLFLCGANFGSPDKLEMISDPELPDRASTHSNFKRNSTLTTSFATFYNRDFDEANDELLDGMGRTQLQHYGNYELPTRINFEEFMDAYNTEADPDLPTNATTEDFGAGVVSNATIKLMHDAMKDLRSNGYPIALIDYDLCFTFRHWRSELQGPTVVLLTLRHPLAVAKTVNQRKGIPMDQALALWEWEMLSAMHEVAGMAILVVSLDELAKDTKKNVDTLRQVLLKWGISGLQVPPNIRTAMPGLDELFSPVNEEELSTKDFELWSSRQKFLYTSLLAMSIDFALDADAIFETSSKLAIGGKDFWRKFKMSSGSRKSLEKLLHRH
mmetsp:Transcript_11458/g.41940  ORF Transcript_11458/g.41940 Transcript_11458/m.41940 type:complete len:630 (-) Transcript_11458:640-2529(-)